MHRKHWMWMLSLALTLSVAGCGEDPAESDQRGVLSGPGELKADGTNSCVGRCGKKAPSGCWCDELCARFGDCCLDKQARCGGAVSASCDSVTCAGGYHCEMKGINGASIPVCIKDLVPTVSCQSVGGYCLALTNPPSQCNAGDKIDPSASCPIVPGSTGTCCMPAPKPSCQSLGGHCLPLIYPPAQCAAGEKADNSGLCPIIPGATGTCCLPAPKPTVSCQSVGGYCLALTNPPSQCNAGDKIDSSASCPIVPGSTGTCCMPAPKPSCQSFGGHCLPLIYPPAQCATSEKADNSGLCPTIPGSTGTCCLPGAPTPLVVTESDSGTTFTAMVGSTVEVRLAGNPTTGYAWNLVSTSKTLPLSSSSYTPDPPNVVGVGGTYSFFFKVDAAAAKAQHLIQLSYARPWEPKPLKTFSVTIQVP